MGQLAQAAQGRTLQKATPQDGIQRMLKHAWPRIEAVMPKHMSSERLFQLAVSTINQTPQLAECDSASLLSCVMKCSALGLEPSAVDGLGRAYILPYRNHGRMQATFILGYKGIIDLARRSGQLVSIHAQAVYEGDSFDFWEDEEGQHFSFRPNRDAVHAPQKLTDVYMTARLKDGGRVFEHMSKAEVDAIRKRSKAANKGPWVTDYEAMALKTVIRRAARYLPMSTQAQEAVAADESTPDYTGVFSPIIDAEGVVVSDSEPPVSAPAPEVVQVPESPTFEPQDAPELELAPEDIEFGPDVSVPD